MHTILPIAAMRCAIVACGLASALGAEIDDALSLLQTRMEFAAVSNLGGRTCADAWGKFGQPLSSSQLVASHGRSLSRVPLPNEGDDDLFVDVPSRFAFCRIQKVGSTKWDAVLTRILNDDTKIGHGFDHSVYDVVSNSHALYGKEAAQKVFSDPGATRAVFVRDPLSRFTSAFLDKCLGSCNNSHCHMRSKPSAGVSMRDAVEWMLAMDKEDLYNLGDSHWKPQSAHCNLKDTVTQYTVVGLFSKEHFSHDAACVMERAGLERFNVPIQNDGAKTFWDESSETKGKVHGGKLNFGYSGESHVYFTEEDLLKKLFTRKAAEKLVSKLSQDYETFNFPKPAWIADATGAWYEEAPQGNSCAGALASNLALVDTQERGDYIEELVASAGYAEFQ